MGEAYGRLPSEVLLADPTAHSRMDLFRFNSDAFKAADQYKEWRREDRRENQTSATQGPGNATRDEKERLVNQQHERAEWREQQEQADDRVASTGDQLDALAAKRQEREQARAVADNELDGAE